MNDITVCKSNSSVSNANVPVNYLGINTKRKRSNMSAQVSLKQVLLKITLIQVNRSWKSRKRKKQKQKEIQSMTTERRTEGSSKETMELMKEMKLILGEP